MKIRRFNEETETHGKNYMILTNLKKLNRLSAELLEKIDDSTDIDEWVADHISTSSDDVEEVFNYLLGKQE